EQPFTGYYFYGDRERAERRGDRSKIDSKEARAVDFSKYNLIKPTTEGYWVLKNGVKKIWNNILKEKEIDSQIDRNESFVPEVGKKLRENKDKIDGWFDEWKEIKDANFATRDYAKSKTERFETFLLKKLGYEGVDVRGLKERNREGSPDKGAEGSVIFDLKPETVVDITPKEQVTEEGKPKTETEKPTEKGKEVSEEEKVKAAKDNLNSVWEKWKQSQNNLGIVFDVKSKANEDMELLEAFLSYIKALGINTAKDIQKAFNDFTGGEATLDDAGADFVAESIKEPVTKKTDKELSREVTFTNIYDIIEKVNKRTPKKANPKEVNKRAYENAYDYLLKSDWFASATDIEQTEAIDDLKKLTGQRRESSPSAQKILGIDSTKEKISVDQKTVRGWMMKDLAEGYKLGKRDAKKVMAAMATLKSGLQRELVAAMREIKSSGKLSKKQVDAIVNKFQKTNVFNPDAVETFLNYIQKVVDNADYVDSVKTANTTRKQIKRRMKNKDVDNNLVQA
ncbi:MAG TPA: hypothetical protein VMW25_02225, partial [Clostridia bacterium]|nr:hypothetical protein [Clostridia bacterium]